MALGRNLKKQSLIPSEEEAQAVKNSSGKAKVQKKKKTAPAKTKGKNAVGKKNEEAPKSQPIKEEVIQEPVQDAIVEEPVNEVIHKSIEEEVVIQGEEEEVVESEVVQSEVKEITDSEVVSNESAEVVLDEVLQEEVIKEAPLDYKMRISQQEFETRKELHDRFHNDVEALRGKVVHVIMFKLGDEEFAIEIGKVNEVVLTPTVTRMPKAPDYIPGMATIRGKSIVTIDMAQKLELQDDRTIEDRRKYTVVINTDKYLVGILVSDVPKNQRISGDIIQTTSDNVSTTSLDETYIKGLIRMSDRVVFFMDIDALIEGDKMQSRVSRI